jgi:hypothetical protein
MCAYHLAAPAAYLYLSTCYFVAGQKSYFSFLARGGGLEYFNR